MKKAAAFLLLLLAAAGLAAQEGRLQVTAPFVSRLQAKAGLNGVELAWRNSPEVDQPCRVYRHSQAIDEHSFAQAAEVAVLPAGAAAFVDYPEPGQDWYYAVLLEDGKGGLHRFFIPFRNVTSTPVRPPAAAPAGDQAAEVSELTAVPAGESVHLSFQSSRGDRELLLFRSAYPMRSAEDLLAASAPATLKAGARTAVDYPVPGIGYYYAVLDAVLFKAGKPVLAAGVNSTTEPVRLTAEAALVPAAAAPRSSGLPYLSLAAEVATGGRLPPAPFDIPSQSSRPLRPETEQALEAALTEAPQRTTPLLKPRLLEPEQAPAGSEAASLAAILNESLLNNDLPAAAARLTAFLSVRRTAEAAARAHFYLGQTYYLQDLFEKASLELLLARDLYYAEVDPWLDASLLALTASRAR